MRPRQETRTVYVWSGPAHVERAGYVWPLPRSPTWARAFTDDLRIWLARSDNLRVKRKHRSLAGIRKFAPVLSLWTPALRFAGRKGGCDESSQTRELRLWQTQMQILQVTM